MDEQDLVRRAKAGDQAAFCQLVLAHQSFIYNIALRSMGNPQEAEDVAQDALLKAWLGLPGFRQQAGFRTWLYRIVVNLCYNRVPKIRRDLSALPLDEAIESVQNGFGHVPVDPQKAVLAGEREAYLHRKVDGLPESYRLLITLRYQAELSYDEIAEVMGIPLGTVKTGLHRAHKQLRQALREFEEVMV